MARKILLKVLPGINVEKKIDAAKAQNLLRHSTSLPRELLRAEKVIVLNKLYFE
jgi:ribosomal protein L1